MASGTPSVMVFDVNETLLDIETLTPIFARVFGDGGVMRQWFAELVLYSQALTLTDTYRNFSDLGAGVLNMLGTIHGVVVSDRDGQELKQMMARMPAHADVAPGLQLLKDAGFRLVTLTNSPPDPSVDRLANAGIGHYFERQFSVETLRRFKPAPQVYRMVADDLGVPTSALCMIAAHAWDTLGAQSVGCAAALVTRSGNAALPLAGIPRPDVIGPDLPAVAAAICRLWR